MADLTEVFAPLVGAAHVLVDADQRAGYEVDWTGRFRGTATAIVRPGSTDEVASVLAACHQRGLAVVPQGGNTGLVGGAVPAEGSVVLSLRRLDSVDVDGFAGQVAAGAGATLGAVQSAAAAVGMAYAVDLSARESATIGGTVATNAGGFRFLRHGGTRQQLLGAEAVLADGAVVSHPGGLLKDNTGYDWPGLLCGSEGTLAVVTAVRCRLVAARREPATALLGFGSVSRAVEAAVRAGRECPAVDAAELMVAAGVAMVAEAIGHRPPFDRSHAALLLLDAAALDAVEQLAALCDALEPDEVAVAASPAQAADLWRLREAHTEAVNRRGPPHKLDVTLPFDALAPFADEVERRVAAVAAGAEVVLFGHAADGNVHVNVVGCDPADDAVDDAVLTLVAEMGGSISAEHGIGRAKRRWLHLCRSPAEIELFRAIKAALDPAGLLNPGVLLPEPAG